jgi:hypothetical protein
MFLELATLAVFVPRRLMTFCAMPMVLYGCVYFVCVSFVVVCSRCDHVAVLVSFLECFVPEVSLGVAF